ncbi:hypothetical protein BD311DRAFT_783359 [Dichomitus squalens]|uniref:Mediator complex subunit 16 C-terminal domain-containing protein n=1 Tax=Dichomitus squalens TaxID=114155 RepID=A0A4Q9N541_9APHY|nr:hypothetical protein BD311DRAFT_783359 [Dichomitus squalens]
MPPIHERNLSIAAKGKAKESVHWHLGWWDLIHSLEGTRRPVQWSKSSVIFTPHESRAYILARHFPTSRQFALPSPPIPLDNYEPATVISLCPTDDWLFAYFPGNGCPGMGCVWRKEAQLDNWSLRECWPYPVGGGVVTAAWTCHHREWVVSETGKSSRLPPLGPLAPYANPLLLLVTEAHLLHVYSLSPYTKTPPPTRAPLLQPIDPMHPPTDPESVGKIGGDRVCVKAAIGLCYQYPTILIAMRSALLPSQTSTQAFQSSMDLGLPVDLGQPQPSEAPFVQEWELWGEEPTISLCEVRIEYRPGVPPVLSRPLPPIHHPSSRLVDLTFYCPPPSHAPNPPLSIAPKADPKGPQHPLYLAATFLDADDYTSIPKSEIISYTFVNGLPANFWGLKSETIRPSQTKVPCFLLPSSARGGFLAGFLDAGGLLPRRKSKSQETIIGSVEMLKPPDLSTHEDWESVPILSHAQHGAVDVPVSVALSPNEALVCCISSPLLGSHFAIQALPRRISGGSSSVLTGHLYGDLSRHLVAAIRAHYSPSDVIHALAMPTLPTEVTVNTLYHALTTMEADSYGLMDMWVGELLGVATEVYSARTQRLDRGPEQELCAARRQTAHEIASLSACCGAFDSCREGDSYDLDAVWQLLGMTGWIIEFVEKLFKECIFVGERPEATASTPTPREGVSTAGKSLDSPIFLHLVHPYALTRLKAAVEHVKRFHDHISRLPAKGEESHIAKDVLLDITEGIGVDLQLVGPLLAEIMQETKGLDAQNLRRSLASCCPVPALKLQIRKIVNKIIPSKAIDRARLFIKPTELTDGVARLALSEPSAGAQSASLREKNTDVVKKSTLVRNKAASVCVRCGGRSDVAMGRKMGMESALSRWQAWEKNWQLRCVCGGLWSSGL